MENTKAGAGRVLTMPGASGPGKYDVHYPPIVTQTKNAGRSWPWALLTLGPVWLVLALIVKGVLSREIRNQIPTEWFSSVLC